MPRVQWPLRHGRPTVQIVLTQTLDGRQVPRNLLADTGAGSQASGFELVLDESDCVICGGYLDEPVKLGGAYSGSFPTYILAVHIPKLGFSQDIRVVGVPSATAGFDGIACFRFLNRFQYGNFGNR